MKGPQFKEVDLDKPHMRFYLKNVKEIPMTLMCRNSYEELHSYEPTMYPLEYWEAFNKRQNKDYDFYEKQLKEFGHIAQIQRVAVVNNEDFLNRKVKIESEDGFVKWLG